MEVLNNVDELVALIKKEEKVIVDFWASWCRPCKVLGPILASLASEFKGVTFCKIEVTPENGTELAEAIPENPADGRVYWSSLPTLVYFLKGQPIAFTRGSKGGDKELLRAALRGLLK